MTASCCCPIWTVHCLIGKDDSGTEFGSDPTLYARGGRFTIATGRCPRSAERIAEAAGVNSPVVTLNGAVVYDFQADRAASQVVLPSSYPEIVRRIHAAFPHIGVQVYIGSWIYVANTDPIVERLFRLEHTERYRRAVSMDALPAEANKVLFGGHNEELQNTVLS